jgi:hypothetical protein
LNPKSQLCWWQIWRHSYGLSPISPLEQEGQAGYFVSEDVELLTIPLSLSLRSERLLKAGRANLTSAIRKSVADSDEALSDKSARPAFLSDASISRQKAYAREQQAYKRP